jgi:hypothetical protein
MIDIDKRADWGYQPTLPPDGMPDVDGLRPTRVVRVRKDSERAEIAHRAPRFVRLHSVEIADDPAPLGPVTQRFRAL